MAVRLLLLLLLWLYFVCRMVYDMKIKYSVCVCARGFRFTSFSSPTFFIIFALHVPARPMNESILYSSQFTSTRLTFNGAMDSFLWLWLCIYNFSLCAIFSLFFVSLLANCSIPPLRRSPSMPSQSLTQLAVSFSLLCVSTSLILIRVSFCIHLILLISSLPT